MVEKQENSPEAKPVFEKELVVREKTVWKADVPMNGGDLGYILKTNSVRIVLKWEKEQMRIKGD